MKSRRRASAKRYRIVFGKLQAGVFALILLAAVAGSFSLGYLWGAHDALSEVAKAGAAPERKVLEKDGEKEAEREAAAALKKKPEPETEIEVANKPAEAIKPKFYQDLLKETREDEQPIEPIKLPVVKKETPPKPAPQPETASVEKAPEKKVDEENDNTDKAVHEAEKPGQAASRTTKPWAKEGGYTIQVVSVKKFDVALRVVRKLRDAGFQPFIKNADLGPKGKWYRVRVGHYRDKAEAQKALSEMQVRVKPLSAKIIAM